MPANAGCRGLHALWPLRPIDKLCGDTLWAHVPAFSANRGCHKAYSGRGLFHLNPPIRHGQSGPSGAGFAAGWPYIGPRGANSALIGFAVDFKVEILQSSVAPIVYLGTERYARPRAFDGAIIQVSDITMRLGTAYVAPTDDTGCSTHGAHNTRPYTVLLIFISARMLLLLGQRATSQSAHLKNKTQTM